MDSNDPRLECLATTQKDLRKKLSDAEWEEDWRMVRLYERDLQEVEQMIANGDLYRPRF